MTPREATYATILTVADAYDVTLAEILGQSCKRRIAWPRQAAYTAVRDAHSHMTLPMIARTFGDRDHTTIIHGIAQHRARMAWAEFLIWAGDADQPAVFARAA